ncbi:hypothetical protein AMS68_004586 [Peltaster fructicola]|uniref:Uncharacterized protein n=1 Tax=Peltaster fructicola TaxID=286661 RepID=A0A6H0XWS5_9PEZI|nr:hypothetical protein AMS68_004586 [Peltaster fructicola]
MAVTSAIDSQTTSAYASMGKDASNEPPARPLPSTTSPSFISSREPSISRGRAQSVTSPRNASPRGITPVSQVRPKQSVDLERKPSLGYGHHRQTSIVHGVQHSRNPSLLSSATTSPLSPARILENGKTQEAGTNGHVVRKSPSTSALQHPAGKDITRPERMRSVRAKRADEHTAQERPAQTQTVGEYALHHLFTSFISEAESKIDRFINSAGQPDHRVERICGPGADPSFDQLLSSLGHINRHKPKTVIDSVMLWRRVKKNDHTALLEQTCQNSEQLQRIQDAYAAGSTAGLQLLDVHQFNRTYGDERVITAELRVQIATYILSRALVEIISQTTIKAMNAQEPDYALRLEGTVFHHLEDNYAAMTHRSALLQANLVIRGQLLGVMSGLRLEEVAKRFAVPLAEDYRLLSVKNPPANLTETARNEWRDQWEQANARTPLLLQSMRWLRFATQPAETWNISCDTLYHLATYFADIHGRQIKHAYADLFEHILLPIAATGNAEFNNQKWKDTLAILRPKVAQMLTKTDHWYYVYPLQAVLLCVSPQEIFAQQWMSTITAFQLKSRDRSGRSHTLKAICRLAWRYLYRLNDSPMQVGRKLDELVKHVFQGGKKYLISTDPIIADPLIQLIRIIGFKYQDICFRTIIFPLMNYELLHTHGDALNIENLDPERTVIGIRAFLAIMTDLEKREPPSFPTSFECDALVNPISRLNAAHKRTRSAGFAVSAGRTERLSKPIMSSTLDDVAQGYYVKFCGILGSLTKICDRMFGGEAVLNEKIAAIVPKTPRTEPFAILRKDEVGSNAAELRQNYYDLLHVAVEALPRCLSPALPISELVSLLCTGTAHSQPYIAASSAQSLKSIARQSYAQVITLGFARFIFNFDDKYATVSDGGLLGPGHIENTLKLYVELLQIWIDDLQRKTKEAAASATSSDQEEAAVRQLPLDLSGILALVDEVESHGLFFLCSPSQSVRAIAVNVLQLVTKFDITLGKPCKRIISILEGSSEVVIDVNDERLTLAERSRLQKGLKKAEPTSTLVELCSSETAHDANLWFKIFPNLVRRSLDICFSTVALTREIVCKRLSHAQATIEVLAQTVRSRYPALDAAVTPTRYNGRQLSASDIAIEQWKLHLIFVCTTMTNIGKQQHLSMPSQALQHTRKSSKSSTNNEDQRIASATELFPKVVDFIFAPNAVVRDAAVIGLGATNATLYQVLLEALHPAVQECIQESRGRVEVHQRTISSPRRSPRTDMLRLGVTHLLSLTVHLLKDPKINSDDYVMEYMAEFAKHLRTWLGDSDIQGHLEYHKLRTHFSLFMEGLYDNTKKLNHSIRWLSFQGRLATFSLMENWCGFSPNEHQLREHENHFRRSILDREHDLQSRGIINSAIEKEKNELQTAALSAMATLCAGSVQFVADNKVLNQFDMRRMLHWLSAIFETPSDRTHAIGRKALQNLIVYNPENPMVMAQSLRMCYTAKSPKALASYFEVVTTVLTEHGNVHVPFWKVLCAGLYTLGNEDSGIRTKSARLLRRLEERQSKTSKLQDLDISVSDKTTAVYKLAQFEISCRLARQHRGLAFHVFSEFSAYFNKLQPDHQRNMVTGMLPWISTIELQLDPQPVTVVPTATSYMLLVNLFEITVKSRNTMHNEVQALWQALATGPYGGNVQLILDFIISLCLNRREQNFVNYTKQIVVFLAGTVAGARVVEYLLIQIQPKTMIAERREAIQPPTDTSGLPYIADLNEILPSGAKQAGLSLGQLSMILLVDLIVTPDKVALDRLVVLLQVILVSWDQYTIVVQEQARELLVHLIHELVISKDDPGLNKDEVEDFVELLRSNDSKIMWSYQDSEVKAGVEDGRAVCLPMGYVIDECVKIFAFVHPTIREEWGKTSMTWATSCAVRHVACRSFQIFRCTSTTLDQQMLANMLARLSNTIADEENPDFMVFSLEILTTLRCIISKIEPVDLLEYPQLFWTTCACLDTIFEPEFQEGLSMLSQLLKKLDLSDPAVLKILEESKPKKWEGNFPGVHALIYKGIRSAKAMDRTLSLMGRLIKLPSHKMVGENDRLLVTILANLPRFLRSFEETTTLEECQQAAEALSNAAESQNFITLSKTLSAFAVREYRSEQDFLNRIAQAIKTTFFTALEFKSLVFLLGMVNNQASWFKVKTMQVLNALLREIDMRKPEIASQGPDMISPLLRLLQTEHCQQALEVLDNVIDMTSSPLDNQHLRMSMAGSHSSRAVRKEYSTTKSLHGIPEESGWSIPMPALHSHQTRQNVHAVFYTLAYVGEHAAANVATTPDVEFQRDDENYDSYFAERTATMMSDDTRTDGNMGELAMKLDSLDDFFDDDDDDEDATPSAGSPIFSGPTEQRETFYDQQALPILHRSLRRNPSVGSLAAQEMNPGAFAQTTRPRLSVHDRTKTSPQVSIRHTPRLDKDMMSGDEAGDEPEPFSDDEVAAGRVHAGDPSVQNTVRPAGFRQGLRQGLRRLTSTNQGSRSTSGGLKSPRMPKLPAMYLNQHPTSADP